jgi:hypothetical protein
VEGGPFLTDEFVAFSKKYVLFLHVTSRIEGRKNDELFFDYDGREFPTLMLLDAEGEVLARRTSGLTVEGFKALGGKAYRYLDLKKKADAGDEGAAIDAALLACDLDALDFYDLEEQLEGKKLSDAQKKSFGALRANVLADEHAQMMRAAKYDGLSVEQAAADFLPLWKDGIAPSRENARRLFWCVLAAHAAVAGDAALQERAKQELAAFRGTDRVVERFRKAIAARKEKK